MLRYNFENQFHPQTASFSTIISILGIVLGSFYYGYMFLQIPGGYMAMKIGGTKIYGAGVLVAAILTLFTPVAARASVWALVALRVGEGLALVSIIQKAVITKLNNSTLSSQVHRCSY